MNLLIEQTANLPLIYWIPRLIETRIIPVPLTQPANKRSELLKEMAFSGSGSTLVLAFPTIYKAVVLHTVRDPWPLLPAGWETVYHSLPPNQQTTARQTESNNRLPGPLQ